jgi:glucose/arabinose dehydrogenase
MDSDYGKIVEVDTVTGSHRIFSSGLRNPQGLYRDKQGSIWETEHGPKGGDELNLIQEGKNYGWPVETFGANYEHYTWPLAGTKTSALDSSLPSLAWLPSVAVSNLIGIDHGVFERWQGDLVMGSLRAMSVFRIHLDGTRPVFNEAIFLGERIRDLALDSTGRIVLWTDNGRIGLLAPLPDRH